MNDDSVDIARYRRVLWASRWRLLGAFGVGIILAILVLQVMPFQYTASVVVRPPDTSSLSLTSGLSALSSLSGISSVLGGADSSDYDTYNDLLGSMALSNYIVKNDPQLLPPMFPTHWDGRKKAWTNDGALNFLKSTIKAIFGYPAWQPPNGEDVLKYITKEVSVSNDYKTNFTTVSFTAQDPVFAKKLVEAMYLGADKLVREQARQRAMKRVAYLERVLPTVTQADERQTLIQLLAASEQTLMTVHADEFYAMRPVDPPILSARPSWPPQPLIVIATAMLAMIAEYLRLLYLPGVMPLTWLIRRASRSERMTAAPHRAM